MTIDITSRRLEARRMELMRVHYENQTSYEPSSLWGFIRKLFGVAN